MTLLIDVDGSHCTLTVGQEDKHLEPNVVYALQNTPWYEKRGELYYFSWYDIMLVKQRLEQLQFQISVTQQAHEKLLDWFRFLSEEDSGIRFISDHQLKNFQHKDVLYCRPRSSAWIGHDMGVGKTYSALGAAYDKFQRGVIDHVLLVAPGGAKKKWAKTISRNLPAPYNSVVVVEGTETEQLWTQKAAWHVLTYAKARTEKDVLKQLFEQFGNLWQRNLLVGDELHRVANEIRYVKGKGRTKVKQTDALQQFARWSVGTIATTGQKISDMSKLYTMMMTIDERFFRSWTEFSQRYLSFDLFIRGKVNGVMREDEIAAKLPMIKNAYSKADVYPDLDPIEFEDRWIELSDREMKLYKQYVKKGFFEQGTEKTDRRGIVQNSLTISTAARRFLDCPALINKSWPKVSSKMKELKMLLDGNDQKVVIFSQWKETCEIVADQLGEDDCYLYVGGAKDDLWVEYLLQNKKKYFVMNTKGKEAIDLHGIEHPKTGEWIDGASVMVMYDELADPGDNDQVHGRIHRYINDEEIMKNWRATVIRLRCLRTCEEHIVKLQEERADFAASLAKNQISFQDLEQLMLGDDGLQ
jgi:hypothetical protein